MTLDDLLEIIQKSNFQNLLSLHRFYLVYRKHKPRGGLQDSYLIGFESRNCKIGFHYEAEVGVAIIDKSSDWEIAEWIDLECVISYLLKRPINYYKRATEYLGKELPPKERFVNRLSAIAEDVELLFDQLVALFSNNEKIAQWKSELEEYIRNDTRRRYGLE
jgi:hypothetical protein